MSVWAAADGFCPARRTFFLGFRLHLLVDSRGGLCDFVFSPADVGERREAEHLLAVEADRAVWQGTVRPLLADNGYCGERGIAPCGSASKACSGRWRTSSRWRPPEPARSGA